MAYTEFCVRPGGSPLNAGTLDGGTTEVDVNPLVTIPGCSISATTYVTLPVGTDMTPFIVGRYVSINPDGATYPAINQHFVGRIINVTPASRIFQVAIASWGSHIGTGSNYTCRLGGAWAPPTSTQQFPFGIMAPQAYRIAVNRPCRVNFKNSVVYPVAATMTHSVIGPCYWQGYASSYGDKGRAVWEGATTGASYNLFSFPSNGVDRNYIIDHVFRNNGATGNADMWANSATSRQYFLRCIFANARGYGIQGGMLIECVAYNCNLVNNLTGGALGGSSDAHLYRCIAHHNSGNGFYSQTHDSLMIDCISAFNAQHGFMYNNIWKFMNRGCVSYGNGGAGVWYLGSDGTHFLENHLAVNNTGAGVNFSSSSSVGPHGWIRNCGFFGNGGGEYLGSSGVEWFDNLSLTADPFVNAAAGDFRLATAEAKNVGFAGFLNDGDYPFGGTNGLPDLGAAQSLSGGGSSGGLLLNPGMRGGMI